MKVVACSLLLVGLAFTSFAKAPSPESVDRLLVLAKVEKTRDAMMVQLDALTTEVLQKQLKGQHLTATDQKAVNEFRAKVVASIKEELSWPVLREVYGKAYARTFSQEEIDGLIAFYSTPAGQSFADKQPLVVEATSRRVLKTIEDAIQGLAEEIVALNLTVNRHPPANSGLPAERDTSKVNEANPPKSP